MALKLQLTSGVKTTQRLSLTQNQKMQTKLPPELLEQFNTLYEGERCCETKSIPDYEAMTATLRRLGVSFKTKVQKKPYSSYRIIVLDSEELPDYGSCDRCGTKLVEVSWCKYCGDNGWVGEDMANKMGGW